MQRRKGAAPRRQLFALPIGAPPSCKRRDPSICAGEPERHQIGMQLLYGPSLFARLASLGLLPSRQILGKRGKLALSVRRRELGSTVFAARCLVTVTRDTPVSRALSRIDSFCRKCIRRMMFNSPMWITRCSPLRGKVTWLSSQ